MHAEDRLIHFSTELLHQPRRHDVKDLQKLYFELSQTSHGYDNTDLGAPGQARFYSKRGQRTQSVALFLPDRVVLIEEWTDTTLYTFLDKLRRVAPLAMEMLNVPSLAAYTATLRSTSALTHFDDARVFLLDHACAQHDRITPFLERPIGTGGLRLVLPETPEYPGHLHIGIESFRLSNREVFVEIKGIYPNRRTEPGDIDDIADTVLSLRDFVTERIYPYLNQFDTPGEVR